MLRALILAFAMGASMLPQARAEEIRAQLDIDQVTVNPRGATIVRRGTVKMPAGEHVIIIENLPDGVPASSIQIGGSGSSAVELGSIDVSRKVVDPADEQGARREIEDRLDRLDDELARQDAVKTDARFRRQTLERLTAVTGAVTPYGQATKAPNVPGPEQIGAVMKVTAGELEQIRQDILQADIAIRKLKSEKEVLRRRLQQLAGAQRSRVRASVRARAATPADLSLSLRYMVNDAGWRPVYDARLVLGEDAAAGELELVQRAQVYQRSGEAWDGVALTLSTAAISGRTSAPELEPIAIMPLPTQPEAREESFSGASDVAGNLQRKLSAAAPVEAERDAVKLELTEATAADAGFHSVYVVPGRTSVSNGGEVKAVRISTRQLKADVRIQAVPALDPYAYLAASFKIDGDSPMLGGEVSLFRDNVFIGKSGLEKIVPGEDVVLGFGRDDLVRVERKELENTAGSSGIITESDTVKRRYVTRIHNLHSFPVSVEMNERMPYSTHEDINVELLEETTGEYELDPDNRRGIVRWMLDLDAGEDLEIRFSYKVSHPGDMQVRIPR